MIGAEVRIGRRRAAWLAVALVMSVLLAGPATAGRAAGRGGAARRAEMTLPLPVTTDAEIALGNLDDEVNSFEARLARAPADGGLRGALVSLLLTRGDFLGSVADYERAERLAEEGVRRRPHDAAAYRARASARSVFHRFEEAWADLAQAEALGARPESLAAARSSILASRGKLDEALAMLPRDERSLDDMGLASLGLLQLEMGRGAEAARLLALARERVRDTSPLPYAWMDYHEAVLVERLGDKVRARALYRRAHAIFPRYTAVAAHLAPYVGAAEGVDMLQRVSLRADDPEVNVARAASLRTLGRAHEALLDEAAARTRYDELTERHPAAFADHAARFWLGPGNDPAKAHGLAMFNAARRPTSVALDLALTTALASGQTDDACDLAARSLALPYADATLRTVARAVANGCPN